MGVFLAPQNRFIDFEQGPSVDITLQWATYRDAADQTSLSRIWGGIHPPADDIVGRRMGEIVGNKAWARSKALFDGSDDSGSATTGNSAGNSVSSSGCSLNGRSNDLLLWLFLAISSFILVFRKLPYR